MTGSEGGTNDAEVMARLDWLLDLEPDERSRALEQLSTERPELHARLVRLLDTALTEASSGVLERIVQQYVATAVDTLASMVPQADQTLAAYRLVRELRRDGATAVWFAEHLEGAFKAPVPVKRCTCGCCARCHV